MSEDFDLFEEYLNKLEDIFTPEELVIELGLTTRDVIEMFRDRLSEFPVSLEKWRYK